MFKNSHAAWLGATIFLFWRIWGIRLLSFKKHPGLKTFGFFVSFTLFPFVTFGFFLWNRLLLIGPHKNPYDEPKKKFFVYDSEELFLVYDTEREAEEAAQQYLDAYASDAMGEEWSEDVTSLCWGEIKQRVREFCKRADESGRFDFIVDYRLEDIDEKKNNRF